MRAGRVEEAGAIAERIGRAITKRNKVSLCRVDIRRGAKDMWAAVRKLTGRQQRAGVVDGVSADSLNEHYAKISILH